MKQIKKFIPLALFTLTTMGLLSSHVTAETPTAANPAFHFFKTYCVSCHGPDKQKGELRLDTLDPDIVNGKNTHEWKEVLDILNKGEMPPKKKKQPTDKEHKDIVDYLTTQTQKAVQAQKNTGGKRVMRRLTNYEYHNTMKDLFHLSLDFAANLPPDPKSKEGFSNNGHYLGISPLQMEYYIKAAQNTLDKAIVSGPQPPVTSASKNFTINSHADNNTQSKKKKKSKKNKNNNSFILPWKKYPREGVVKITIKAAARQPEALTTMKVKVGYHVDAKDYLWKEVSAVDVTASPDNPGTFHFAIRIEDFPLPAKVSKFPDLFIAAEAVGAPQDKKKKGRKNTTKEPAISNLIVESISVKGPCFDSWPPRSHQSIFIESKNKKHHSAYAKEVITHFMQRAWRRQVTQTEISSMVSYFEKSRQHHDFVKAIKETLVLILVSPDFLYLMEPTTQLNTKEALTQFELANRLSYLFWSSMPDSTLFNLAEEGQLNNPSILKDQVQRLLSSPKSKAFVNNFTRQWLQLDKMVSVAVNPQYYPDFNNQLKDDMILETQSFFNEILKNDLSALNFIDSNFTMLNARLAKHYNIPFDNQQTGFHKTPLKPEYKRGGLLTQGSILLANSTGDESHAILRGVWVLDRLLGDPPPSPPPNVPSLEESVPNFASLPLKEQLAIHLKDNACARCHQKMDPYGIAMEQYDAVGSWRNEARRLHHKNKSWLTFKVDAVSQLPDNSALNGIDGLKKHLLTQRRDDFAEGMVRHLLTYALGRSLEFGDTAAINELKDNFIKNNFKLATLIEDIVLSKLFQSK